MTALFKNFLLLVPFLLCSCIKSTYQSQIGKDHWELGETDISQCSGGTDEAECKQKLIPNIIVRAEKLCGDQSKPVLEKCRKDQKKGLFTVVCELTCKTNTVPLAIDTPVTKDTYLNSAQQITFLLSSPKLSSLMANKKIIEIKNLDKGVFLIRVDSEKKCTQVTTKEAPPRSILSIVKKACK